MVKHEKVLVLVQWANPCLLKLDEAWAWGWSLQRQVEGYFTPADVWIPFRIQDPGHVLAIQDFSESFRDSKDLKHFSGTG